MKNWFRLVLNLISCYIAKVLVLSLLALWLWCMLHDTKIEKPIIFVHPHKAHFFANALCGMVGSLHLGQNVRGLSPGNTLLCRYHRTVVAQTVTYKLLKFIFTVYNSIFLMKPVNKVPSQSLKWRQLVKLNTFLVIPCYDSRSRTWK